MRARQPDHLGSMGIKRNKAHVIPVGLFHCGSAGLVTISYIWFVETEKGLQGPAYNTLNDRVSYTMINNPHVLSRSTTRK